MFNNELLTKPASAAAIAILLDRFFLKNTSVQKNLVFGASVAIGIAVGSMVGDNIPQLPNVPLLGNGKEIGSRLSEVAVGAGTTWAVNKWVMKNDSGTSFNKRILVIVAADIAGEYASDYMSSRPLALFA
jgi:hypothetical protein